MKCPSNYGLSRLVRQAVKDRGCRVVSHRPTFHVLRLTFLGRTAVSLMSTASFTVMLNKANIDLFHPSHARFEPHKNRHGDTGKLGSLSVLQ